MKRCGAGLRPYSYIELICGWDAPPSSPARAEMDVVCLTCTVLLSTCNQVLEWNLEHRDRFCAHMHCVGTVRCQLMGILKNEHRRATKG